MSEEIKQDWRKKLEHVVKYRLTTDFVTDRQILTELFDSLLSQALQKRDEEIIKMLGNTDVQMSVNGDVSKDEIAMAKFIYKAHIKHIIKKIESAIIPPNSINGTLPSETDSAIK